MNFFEQFLLYNLLPSVLVGFLAWLVVVIALKYLPIHDPQLRLSFLGVPVIKSALVLLGIAAVLPWPQPFFNDLQANALPLQQLLSALSIWVVILLLAYLLFVRQVRRSFLQQAYTAGDDLAQRLDQSLQRVRDSYHQKPVPHLNVMPPFAHSSPQPPPLSYWFLTS